MAKLTLEQAKTILKKHTTEDHLFTHAAAVSAAMGAMAEHFGEDKEYWEAVGYLHDVDYEKYPDEHCKHVREFLEPEGIDDETIETIISHGWGLCVDEPEPTTPIAKSLFTVDELTGIVQAYGLMRPEGLDGMAVKSLKKKFKDKHFAAGCSRDVIRHGAELNGMELDDLFASMIEAMRAIAPDRDEWLKNHPEQ